MPIRLRSATPADRDAVVTLAQRLADFDLPAGRAAHEIARADLHHFDRQLTQPAGDVLFLVAEDEGAILGTVFANTDTDYFTGEPLAYIEVLAVAEAAAGRGVARQLMEATERWAAKRGYGRVELSVFVNNRRARGFYEHLGYREEILRCVKEVGSGK
ncbi:MAG TPA: GNAT family N-acetyltransferase [Gemmatimonadales bacterium]|nr:GNAT family N-acetyltransferase [Gemmatimonadales bacterium]